MSARSSSPTRVLGIETSCDETGVAVWDSARGLLSHQLHSQTRIHQDFGGIVPELASRDHIRRLPGLTRAALGEAGLAARELDAIAYTAGPGLIGALLTGSSFACSMAYALDKPTVPVHHMEAHLLAPMMGDDALRPPFVALLVSGGHTLLVEVRRLGVYQVLGQTIDDAVGEAFDKTARTLGLPYPGGPSLAKCAEDGDPARFHFPRPMLDREGCDFSFSGLKTHALRIVQKHADAPADIAAGFQEAVVDVLVEKSLRALHGSGMRQLIVSGGVGANRLLRQRLQEKLGTQGMNVAFPPPEFCTDNGAMIAYAGTLRLSDSTSGDRMIRSRARWPLSELAEISAT